MVILIKARVTSKTMSEIFYIYVSWHERCIYNYVVKHKFYFEEVILCKRIDKLFYCFKQRLTWKITPLFSIHVIHSRASGWLYLICLTIRSNAIPEALPCPFFTIPNFRLVSCDNYTLAAGSYIKRPLLKSEPWIHEIYALKPWHSK